jgi:hypothetical protein
MIALPDRACKGLLAARLWGPVLRRAQPHEHVSENHKAAPFAPSARPGELRQQRLLGPGSRELRIPQPPSPPGFERTGSCSAHGSIPQCFRPAFAGLFFRTTDDGGQTTDGRSPRLSDPSSVLCRPSSGFQRTAARAAPSMAPGRSAVPACRITAAASALSISAIGTLKLRAVPFQSPSLTQRRTTLW